MKVMDVSVASHSTWKGAREARGERNESRNVFWDINDC